MHIHVKGIPLADIIQQDRIQINFNLKPIVSHFPNDQQIVSSTVLLCNVNYIYLGKDIVFLLQSIFSSHPRHLHFL
jgi:hypothetical protein